MYTCSMAWQVTPGVDYDSLNLEFCPVAVIPYRYLIYDRWSSSGDRVINCHSTLSSFYRHHHFIAVIISSCDGRDGTMCQGFEGFSLTHSTESGRHSRAFKCIHSFPHTADGCHTWIRQFRWADTMKVWKVVVLYRCVQRPCGGLHRVGRGPCLQSSLPAPCVVCFPLRDAPAQGSCPFEALFDERRN